MIRAARISLEFKLSGIDKVTQQIGIQASKGGLQRESRHLARAEPKFFCDLKSEWGNCTIFSDIRVSRHDVLVLLLTHMRIS